MPKCLRREGRAQAAPAGDDLVEDEQDAVPRADVAQPLEVALGGHQHAARGRDRVDDQRGDVRGVVQRDDAALELVGELRAEIGLSPRKCIPGRIVRVPEVVHARHQHAAVGLAVRRHAADRHAADVDAVVRALAADEARTRALAPQAMVGDRDLERGVDRLGARVGEENLLHALRRDGGDALGEAEGQRMAERERGREVELARLAPDRLDDARPAVPRVDAPQRRQAVEHLLSFDRREVHVLRRGDEARLGLESPVVGERHPVVLEVDGAHGLQVDACVHDATLRFLFDS